MLRNLRSRRRPRYGAQVCALISALLLLFSVSLLHTRLSISSKPHIYHRQHDDVLPANPLLSDSEEDFLTTDDKIDELDTLEETDPVLNEDEVDQELQDTVAEQGKISSSGNFYFDHWSGAIRRGFSNRRSIEEWDFDYTGFNEVALMEDGSKLNAMLAFASDDVPVDEEVRRMMSEVEGIEDALLLKVGKRVSPLREKWGVWFDKKGDFLRRDRMFRSNLDVLNPLNNPLLQDPDGVGVTGLTRGDKAVQKWLLSQFKRVPFTGKRPLGVLQNDPGTSMAENVGDSKKNDAGSKVKSGDRRTLDDDAKIMLKREHNANADLSLSGKVVSQNVSDGNDNSELNDEKVNQGSEDLSKNLLDAGGRKDQVVQVLSNDELQELGSSKNVDYKAHERGSDISGHIYADGKRWGYYPGLHPRLSFSEFMDEFFQKGDCDMRVFMIWNSPPWMYSVRHQRGLESLLAQHRDACVVLFSETIELDFFRENFVKDGYKVAVVMPNLDEMLKDTPTHVFASVWFKWRKTRFYSVHYSELVRLAALYKYGGIYLDSDIIVLKPLSSINNSIGHEDQLAGSSLNGAVMAFAKKSPFIMECLKEFYMSYDDAQLRWNGADLLTRVARRFLTRRTIFVKQLELKVQPSFLFFPISSQHVTRYFVAAATESEKAEQDTLFKKILNESLTFHFWNGLTSGLIPEPGSLVTRLIDHFCIRCSDLL